MNLHDAAQLLSLSGTVTPAEIKQAYRAAAQRYHPDRNPAGLEMMKLINAAYEALKASDGELEAAETDEGRAPYPEAVNEALNAIIGLAGLSIEICGAWVWVGGETYAYRAVLKQAGFHYAAKKQRWYFRPEDWASRSRGTYSMDDIRDKYGSEGLKGGRSRRALPNPTT